MTFLKVLSKRISSLLFAAKKTKFQEKEMSYEIIGNHVTISGKDDNGNPISKTFTITSEIGQAILDLASGKEKTIQNAQSYLHSGKLNEKGNYEGGLEPIVKNISGGKPNVYETMMDSVVSMLVEKPHVMVESYMNSLFEKGSEEAANRSFVGYALSSKKRADAEKGDANIDEVTPIATSVPGPQEAAIDAEKLLPRAKLAIATVEHLNEVIHEPPKSPVFKHTNWNFDMSKYYLEVSGIGRSEWNSYVQSGGKVEKLKEQLKVAEGERDEKSVAELSLDVLDFINNTILLRFKWLLGEAGKSKNAMSPDHRRSIFATLFYKDVPEDHPIHGKYKKQAEEHIQSGGFEGFKALTNLSARARSIIKDFRTPQGNFFPGFQFLHDNHKEVVDEIMNNPKISKGIKANFQSAPAKVIIVKDENELKTQQEKNPDNKFMLLNEWERKFAGPWEAYKTAISNVRAEMKTESTGKDQYDLVHKLYKTLETEENYVAQTVRKLQEQISPLKKSLESFIKMIGLRKLSKRVKNFMFR